jgi:high-affinity iron transporter
MHLSAVTAALQAAVLVFREGLESILVLAVVTASFVKSNRVYRKPVAVGAALAFAATLATWMIVVALIGSVKAPELYVQAATGLLAVAVLLVVMNWFFHKIYWTGWIAHHNQRRQQLLEAGANRTSGVIAGLVALGFTSVYREGVEVVLFLQNLRLQSGSAVVLQGALLGLAATLAVGVLTFVVNQRLPYRRMLVLTGLMLGFVLMIMVGESAQEMQLAGWLPTTPLAFNLPTWTGVWFALSPTLETMAAQLLAALLVIGAYVAAEQLKKRRTSKSLVG